MTKTEVWRHIHDERSSLADLLSSLTADQWAAPSWCAGWSVQLTAGHVLAAAEQTVPNFYRELATAGFRFDVFTDRGARKLGALEPDELVRRLRARTSTTNHPPAPIVAMLGEVIAHGEDIRRPLGLRHRPSNAALVAVADSWQRTNLLIGSKRRIAGLRLQASDLAWSHGDGPEVIGPMLSLVMAMVGRKEAQADLSGEGLVVLTARS
jgi:uncharacterized protein (TIGR03083 family)